MTDLPPDTRLRLRLHFGPVMLGPGKADLLEQIARTGSIAAAGRAMGMSYKRAWLLVEDMNHAFAAPLVDSARGGAKGGGAQLTGTGQTVLTLYRKIEDTAAEAGAAEIDALHGMLAPCIENDMSNGE
ncbi:LysR family transcriptional regulator [Mesobacterium sp. TK19101]|uniref:LysR family transcriptional regulator n=1 Tax=Mesobacterium hydrothermale TaxID=3111907 RepID=A0ABU6HGX5_9RHOB|nr:LysR family transcriptional regulator [Mesobacterium sp. TK19101]MEC3861708.1 LysR family transcriptional regulator [Mesobacterium sp. TK19101]